MTDAVIQVPPDSTGKMIDAESLTVSANTVYRQRFELSGAAAAAIASVINSTPAGTEYALVTRPMLNQYYDTTVGPTNITALNANLTSGVATANSFAAISTVGMETVGMAITAVGVGTLIFQGSIDGTNWLTMNAVTPQGVIVTTTSAIGGWLIGCAGFASVRVTASAYTSGTFTAYLRATLTEGNVGLDTPLPAGANVIGGVTGSGTFTTKETRSSTGSTPFNVTASITSVVLLASNANRLGAIITNDQGQTQTGGTTGWLYIGYGQTPTLTSYHDRLAPNGRLELPFGFTGAINGIWDVASGFARGGELT